MNKHVGFTLIELMIVMAIIGILASVASPMYGNYTKRAKFSDVINQTTTFKSAVGLCVQDRNEIVGCNHNTNGIPDSVTNKGNLALLTVSDGTITAVGTEKVDQADYILIPTWDATSNTLDWTVAAASTCIDTRLCRQE